ncbi:hypothetical protein [Streptomyces sp. NPDC055709]
MNNSSLGKLRSAAFAAASTITVASVLATASTAAADNVIAGPDKAASSSALTVERATGTSDLASTIAKSSTPAEAVVRSEFGHVTVSTPPDSSGRVVTTAADGSTFQLGLPGTAKVPGVKAGAGTVVYPNAAKATDFAVQPTSDGGARTLITLKDSSAPRDYRFDLDLPEGASLAADGNGGYMITKQSATGAVVLGAVESPWAKDAKGRPVSTEYQLDGHTLVQTVTPGADAAYPIVADPKVSYGVRIYMNFSKAEVKKHAAKMKAAPGGAALCGLLGIPAATIPCSVLVGAHLTHLAGVWSSAATYNKCVEMSFTYTGQYSSAKNYKC